MSPQNPIDRLFGAVVPRAVDAVDIESVIEQVDIDKLVSEVDLDRVLEGVDLQKLLERIDLDALLQRIDLDALLVRLDLDALVSRLDLNTLISGVDIDGLIQRVDVDGLIKRVDVDGIIQEVDIDGLIGRVDMPALMKRAQIDVIVSNASRGVFTRVLDALRRQLAGLDLVLIGVVNRVFRRPRELDTITDGTVTGRLAGGISRLAAFAIDAFTIAFSYGVMVAIGMFLVGLFMGRDVTADHAALWYALGYAGYGFFYYWIGLLLTGRSIGKGLIGLRVVGPAGVPISPRRAAIRTLVYPLSFILWIGLIPIVTGKRRRALHDWAAGSTVVYDWGDRPSELPAPVTDWLRRHDVDASRPRTVPAVSSVAVVSSNGTAASAATGTPGDTIGEAPTVDTPTSANP
ncbi:MAG: RDD family protein [Acidimicrobiales bacterium]